MATFVDRFTAANDTNLHGRTPSGAPDSYDVNLGSFSIQSNAAQSGGTNSRFFIDTGMTSLIYSAIIGHGAATNDFYFRWDKAGNTGWIFHANDGQLVYYNGSTETQHATYGYNFPGNGTKYYFEFILTDTSAITVNAYNLQFSGTGWVPTSLSVSSTLNNDKTHVGFLTTTSGISLDCLRCHSGSYDYPQQGLLEARIQKGILLDHVPYIISSYDTGIPDQVDVWGNNSTYSAYYDGPSALYQLYDLWGATDGASFYEAAWKQFQILHNGYYVDSCTPDYAASGFQHFSRGPYQDWVRRSNADAYATVRYLPQRAAYAASGDCSIDGTDDPDSGRHRECAYALAAHVWAYKIGGVAASEVDVTRWGVLREWCYDWVDYWCDEVTPGVYAWSGTERQVAVFMLGLMARSLWDDYTATSDSRFQATLLKLCNFAWDEFWLPANSPYPGMLYDMNPDSTSYGSVGVQSDLNNLITAAFAKCAQLTGDSTHMDRADTLFANAALYGDYTTGGKQKNQQTTWLKDYIDWRADFSAAVPSRRSGRLLRRSA
jgi:hypothetical protein